MKNIIIRLVIVILFLVLSITLINMAPEYELTYKYKDGDLRVIYNNIEITSDTNRLPEVATILNNEIMLSNNTIDYLFDKYLFYDQKYNTLITTTDSGHIAKIEVGSDTMMIDGVKKSIKVRPVYENYSYKTDDRYKDTTKADKKVIYVPISDLAEIYDIEVEFKDKVIITNKNINRTRVTAKSNSTIEVKYLENINSKTIATAYAGDFVDIFNFDKDAEYNLVRTSSGELGYVLTNELLKNDVKEISTKKDKVEEKEKINLAWDYVNKDVSSIGSKSERERINKINIVAPTLLYLQNTNGEVQYRINAIKEYMDWANSRGYKVWMTFKNDYQTISETSVFLNDTKHRERAIEELLQIAEKYKFEGINVDFENMYKEDAEVFAEFIRELSIFGHLNNLIISVCTNVPDGSDTWSLCYDHKALSEAADYVAIMTYDEFGSSSKIAGPNASYEWVEENIQKLVERDHVEPNKLLLGLATYSRMWTTVGGVAKPAVLEMSKAISYLKDATWDDEAKQYYYVSKDGSKQLWIENADSLKEKIKLVDIYGLSGTSIWRLGFETDDIWNEF